jgi:nucleotide-binding universal stress UspA family protein
MTAADTVNVTRPIVVGIDGGPGALRAAEYTAILAERLDRPLALVTAYRGAPVIDPIFPPDTPRVERLGLTAVAYAPYSAGVSEEVFRATAENALQAAADAVKASHPALDVTSEAVHGAPSRVLANASRFALLVVVGRSHVGHIERILTGSTVSAVLAHATTPVIVVPPDWSSDQATGDVVVGLEGTQSESSALQFAFGIASATKAGLTVVHANRFLEFAHNTTPTVETEAARIAEADRWIMAKTILGWQEAYPDVTTEIAPSTDGPATALVERSTTASLVVVGSRARGGFARLQLGSTARAVALHAQCPVAVVRAAATAAQEPASDSESDIAASG